MSAEHGWGSRMGRASVAVVDFGMGNLFSVMNVCQRAGLSAAIVSTPRELAAADAVILPGVGGFPEAMRVLQENGLVAALQETVAQGKILVGICLGHQLLFDESDEVHPTKGLGLIPGRVVRLPQDPQKNTKIPHIGWKQIVPRRAASWEGTLLENVAAGQHMYYVHSYYARPESDTDVIATSTYDGTTFCAAARHGNVHGFQFHPERSGEEGIALYLNLRHAVERMR